MKEDISDISPELLLRYCRGECSATERVRVEAAAALSRNMRDILDDMQASVALAEDMAMLESFDLESSYASLLRKVRKNRFSALRRITGRVAAILFVPVLAAATLFGVLYFKGQSAEVCYSEITAPSGSVLHFELPDESSIWLNAGSTLRYPDRFTGRRREVSLNGEAYFDVSADPDNPFYVNTGSGFRVYVYGTKFNVNAYDGAGFVETVLSEGAVNAIVPDGATVIKLEPGECLYYDTGTEQLDKSKVDSYEKTAWKDGKMIFRNAPLEQILDRLAKHFNVDIELDNPMGREYRYRASFSNETLYQILDYLDESANMQWRVADDIHQEDDYTITKKRIVVTLK